MKKTLIALACSLLVSVAGAATTFSSGSTAISTNLAVSFAPLGSEIQYVQAYGYNNGTLQLHFKNATKKVLVGTAVTANYSTNIACTLTTGDFSDGDEIVIQDVSAGTYTRAWCLTNGVAGLVWTNIYTTAQLGTSVSLVAGDAIYKVESQTQQRVPNDTVRTLGGNGGVVWKTGTIGPSTVEAICNQTTLLTNTWVGISGIR